MQICEYDKQAYVKQTSQELNNQKLCLEAYSINFEKFSEPKIMFVEKYIKTLIYSLNHIILVILK